MFVKTAGEEKPKNAKKHSLSLFSTKNAGYASSQLFVCTSTVTVTIAVIHGCFSPKKYLDRYILTIYYTTKNLFVNSIIKKY